MVACITDIATKGDANAVREELYRIMYRLHAIPATNSEAFVKLNNKAIILQPDRLENRFRFNNSFIHASHDGHDLALAIVVMPDHTYKFMELPPKAENVDDARECDEHIVKLAPQIADALIGMTLSSVLPPIGKKDFLSDLL